MDLHLVQLDRDHPGFRDPVYRARRNAIAQAAIDHREGDPVPVIAYTEDEHAVWRTVWEHLGPLHERLACRQVLEGERLLPLDRLRAPQLGEVNAALAAHGPMRLRPVAGLMTPLEFLEHLGRDVFLATQYMRHGSRPLYTPEPDVIHELVGHAASLAHPRLRALHAAFGEAAARAGRATGSGDRVQALIRGYWYTLEFGLVREDGQVKALGAGLLSSYGELERVGHAPTLLPLDLDVVAATPFDPTDYQATLFVAESFDALEVDLTAWLRA